MLCLKVNRKSCDCSEAEMPVAAAATAIVCTLIIFPVTPPAELDAAINAVPNPSRPAVMTCRLPNSAFDEVSEPVRNTPSQPNSELKKGNSTPVAAKAKPKVPAAPQ